MALLKTKFAILLVASLLLLSVLTSCKDVVNGYPADQTMLPVAEIATITPTIAPVHTAKPGYNPYGIPGAELWQTMDENGAEKENINEIVASIKVKWGIPDCITGIPWDDRARGLLLNKSGNLVSNWNEVVQGLMREWGAID